MTDAEKHIEEYIESKLIDLSSYLKPKRPVRMYIEDDTLYRVKNIDLNKIVQYLDNLPEEEIRKLHSYKPSYFLSMVFNEKELEALYGKERVREQDTEKSTKDNN